jgi:hypothetical protein
MKFQQYAEQAEEHMKVIHSAIPKIDMFQSGVMSACEMHIVCEEVIRSCEQVERIMMDAVNADDVSVEEFMASLQIVAGVLVLHEQMREDIKKLNAKFH